MRGKNQIKMASQANTAVLGSGTGAESRSGGQQYTVDVGLEATDRNKPSKGTIDTTMQLLLLITTCALHEKNFLLADVAVVAREDYHQVAPALNSHPACT